nr:hypothetical protein [uncultured Bacteroides sp.]
MELIFVGDQLGEQSRTSRTAFDGFNTRHTKVLLVARHVDIHNLTRRIHTTKNMIAVFHYFFDMLKLTNQTGLDDAIVRREYSHITKMLHYLISTIGVLRMINALFARF